MLVQAAKNEEAQANLIVCCNRCMLWEQEDRLGVSGGLGKARRLGTISPHSICKMDPAGMTAGGEIFLAE